MKDAQRVAEERGHEEIKAGWVETGGAKKKSRPTVDKMLGVKWIIEGNLPVSNKSSRSDTRLTSLCTYFFWQSQYYQQQVYIFCQCVRYVRGICLVSWSNPYNCTSVNIAN